jgi:arylsulfatase A-like enzyme
MFGKWHLGYREGVRPTERGFQEFYGSSRARTATARAGAQDGANALLEGTASRPATSYLTVELARRAAEFVARHEKEPFFLYVPFNAVHAPLQALPRALTAFDSVADDKRKTFMAMLATLDEGVGTVLAEIEKRGLVQDTLVLFVSTTAARRRRRRRATARCAARRRRCGRGASACRCT